MLTRVLIASIGAIAVTIALLLMMNRAANHLVIQDPLQYFGVSDFIPHPDAHRPRPPPPPQPRPEVPAIETIPPFRIDVPLEPVPAPVPQVAPGELGRETGTVD